MEAPSIDSNTCPACGHRLDPLDTIVVIHSIRMHFYCFQVAQSRLDFRFSAGFTEPARSDSSPAHSG